MGRNDYYGNQLTRERRSLEPEELRAFNNL